MKIALSLKIQRQKKKSAQLTRLAPKMPAVLLLCGCLAGCGSSNLSGNWQFTLKSASTGNTYTGTASITQATNTVGSIGGHSDTLTGTLNFANDPCATAAQLSGTITGASVVLSFTEGSQPVSLTGTVNSGFTAMSGTYTSAFGGCMSADFGSWTASKS
jgi:hypothetical protein